MYTHICPLLHLGDSRFRVYLQCCVCLVGLLRCMLLHCAPSPPPPRGLQGFQPISIQHIKPTLMIYNK